MQNIVPNLWANGNATQMGEFYARTFPGASSRVTSTYPNEGLLEFQRHLAGKPLGWHDSYFGTGKSAAGSRAP